MLIVISNPTPITKEASLINQLFDEGLSVFHMRKPDSSAQELVLLLQEIEPKHYSKIALHSHHYLAKSFGIDRLHYTEASRKQAGNINLLEQEVDNILSTSIHSVADHQNLGTHFKYAFLSPVFDSISKPNYQACEFNLTKIDKNSPTKLIALGGINETNCQKAYEMGFDGIAVLGAIWNSENKIEAFKQISQMCANENAELPM
jgi:thiamine-phosphate pyrophosphorylase